MNLDDCEKIFEEALSCTSEESFCDAVAPLFRHYQILSVDWGRGSIFWRARIIDNKPFENLSEMDYPPPNIAKIGRLNNAGSPCFYVAAKIETAIAEVDAKEGQLIQLAGYRVLDANPVRLALIGEYSNVQKLGYMRFMGSDPDMALSRILNAMPRSEGMTAIYIDKFFAHILDDPNARRNNYLMSRALGRSIYDRNKADGIVFPSVKDPGGTNIGIQPDPSDRSFHNVCCLVAKLGKERRFGLLDFEVIKSAKMLDSNSNFVWGDFLVERQIGVYGMNKNEYELVKSSPNDKNALLNLLHPNRSRQNP